jgi:CO/xanthine dehydrogenase FAD-binding subunit
MTDGQFFKAASPEEACDLLAEYGNKARLLAGGTDVMVAVNLRQFNPEVLIDIGDAGLGYIKMKGDTLVIGAATTFSEILESNLIREKAPLLAKAAANIASVAIRNVGTVGGNLANGSPAADSATALMALDATLKLVSKGGERTVPADQFFQGPGKTVLGPGEIIQEIRMPAQKEGIKWGYHKIGKRKAQSLSVVSAAVCCLIEGGICKEARIALGAVAPTPILATGAAERLKGKSLNESLINETAKAAADATSPVDDVRGSAWYRRRASEALVRQLLTQLSA